MMRHSVSFIKFADVKVPVLRELPNKGWVLFGEDNKFPNMLLNMFNKSSKHNGIVLGKVNYIVGKGFDNVTQANAYENSNEILKKLCLDIEVFGGCYIEVQYNELGKIGAYYHVPYHKVRSNKDNTQFFVKDWETYKKNDEPKVFLAYNPNQDVKQLRNQTQILYYKEYRPGVETYSYPGYMGALNAIQTDIEISKYHLSTITNGMFASKMISFFEGIPSEEEKREIEKGFKSKFTGSENAGNIVLNFGKDPAKRPQLDDLSSTELDKHFDILAKSIQQELFAGHQVVSPMLFGIRVEGQLGGRSEIREAYEIFKSTYCNDKQQALELLFKEVTGVESKIVPVDPISFEFSETIVSQNMTKDEIRQKIGLEPLSDEIKTQAQIISENINSLSPLVANKVLESMTVDEIRSLAGLVPKDPNAPTVADGSMPAPSNGPSNAPSTVNENLKNLTGRQWQSLTRIIRKFEKGEISQEQAKLLLKSSLGLNDDEVNTMLAIDNEVQEFSSHEKDELLLAEFAKCGESKNDYLIVKSSKFVFGKETFADVTQIETNVLDLLRKDKRITPEVIAETLDMEVDSVKEILKRLAGEGRISIKIKTVGQDEVIERTLTEPLKQQTDKKPETLNFKILYSYEGPEDSSNRAFCAKLLEMNKLWSRSEIESMSMRMGYSVWDRRGGWWTKPNGDHSISCRHEWRSNIVMKKK
jgi:DNA-binding Lrp family transcriptional regulator